MDGIAEMTDSSQMTETMTTETNENQLETNGESVDTAVTEKPKGFEAKLCDYLVEKGRIKEEDLQRGVRLHHDSFGGSLVPLLVRLGLASERDVALSLHELMDLPLMDDKVMPETVTIDTEFPLRFMRESQFVPIDEDEETLSVVMVYPYDEFLTKA